ncbi:Sporulation related domain-containing protein [Sphingomonas laterariae]|uniref:Sporulation related domain-containing protein n=1 Tax=Edaphosphingomonas laterariae TaxID=861865 RepID=A0A239CHD3_9SPHN|nr:SPOR domain-containing protein [Sphingomonas laterariae]SNS19369.1 Sporulation related domain-containing protein [Sphingomonas laterariae]
MTDADRGRFGLADEDRLPWLEAVEDEDDQGGVGLGKLIGAVIAALVFIGLVVGGIFWMRNREAPSGSGELIAAPEGDYKVPAEGAIANGMAVQGEGDAAYATSEGQTLDSTINPHAQPEAPIAGVSVDVAPVRTTTLPPSQVAGAAPAPNAAAAPAPKPATPAPARTAEAKPAAPAAKPAGQPTNLLPGTPAPMTKPAMAGGTIQLGAFNSESIAIAEWGRLAPKFPELGKLNRSITTVEVGGKTLYRLRASGIGAREACKSLKAAGKPCNPV